jgi:uncharacterized protein (DUF736 family)
MKIGELQERTTSIGKIRVGAISTMAFSIAIELIPAPKSENPNAPAFIIFGKSDHGARVPIGAAWIKQLKRGPNSGAEFLTITIDDPSLPRPLHVAAFKNVETGIWEIMFRRRQAQSA